MTTYLAEQAMNCHVLKTSTGTAVRVYNYLRSAQTLAEAHGRAYVTPRAKTIAEDLGRHIRTIKRALAALRAAGALVCQARYVTRPGGLRRQISNRIRVIVSTVQALDISAKIAERARSLVRYRGDKPVTPRTENLMSAARRCTTYSQLSLEIWERTNQRFASESRLHLTK